MKNKRLSKLLNGEYDECCVFCENSRLLSDGTYLCEKKGVVSPDFRCRRFYFDLMRINMKTNFSHTEINLNEE